jgi:hypothetical protein
MRRLGKLELTEKVIAQQVVEKKGKDHDFARTG